MSNSPKPVNSFCPQADICSVCQWIETPRQQQISAKSQILTDCLNRLGQQSEFDFIDLGPGFLRTRVDLTLTPSGELGFYKKETKDIFNLGPCPQLNPKLKDFLQEFQQKYVPKINKKGSVRLRVYEDTDQLQHGVWLDFSHADVKDLFSQEDLLLELKQKAHVEVGQRRKTLIFDSTVSRFKLTEVSFKPWATSFTETKKIPLLGQVASFTQTGPVAEEQMARFVSQWVKKTMPKTVHEFGPGLGTLSFAAAEFADNWKGYDNDSYAASSLQKTLEAYPEFASKMKVFLGNFHKPLKQHLLDEDLFLLNPARSGIGSFLQEVQSWPKHLLYISCFVESFEKDMQALTQHGYSLVECKLLDQFPQSKHFEILSFWQRN